MVRLRMSQRESGPRPVATKAAGTRGSGRSTSIPVIQNGESASPFEVTPRFADATGRQTARAVQDQTVAAVLGQ